MTRYDFLKAVIDKTITLNLPRCFDNRQLLEGGGGQNDPHPITSKTKKAKTIKLRTNIVYYIVTKHGCLDLQT